MKHYIVYIRSAEEKFRVMEINRNLTDPEAEVAIADKENAITPGRWAYVRADAENPQGAANQAREKKLVYIPYNFIQGMKERRPAVIMPDIRREFARRTNKIVKDQRADFLDDIFDGKNPFANLFDFGKNDPKF